MLVWSTVEVAVIGLLLIAFPTSAASRDVMAPGWNEKHAVDSPPETVMENPSTARMLLITYVLSRVGLTLVKMAIIESITSPRKES